MKLPAALLLFALALGCSRSAVKAPEPASSVVCPSEALVCGDEGCSCPAAKQ